MPNMFLERYISGEQERVWRDLVELGDRVRREPYLSDAQAVAAETMKRARHNIHLIRERLDALGFQFEGLQLEGKHHGTLKPITDGPTGDTLALLDGLEKRLQGPLPISLRSWYEHIDGVCLWGYHPVITPHGERRLFQNPRYQNALIILPVADLIHLSERFNSDDDIDDQDVFSDSFDLLFWNERQGWKEWVMEVPDPAADARIHGLDKTFVEHLRNALSWGGFPGWEGAPGAPVREINYLREGLLPI